MIEDLPYWWHVTSYDPARRDARGAYPPTAWTSIADVGRVFEAELLTQETYDWVEAGYIGAFLAFANASGAHELQIRTPG